MPKSVAVMILASPYGGTSSQTALHYCQALLEQGHSIYRLFFYNEGAYNAIATSESSQDELNICSAWQQLVQSNKLDAVVCIASGLKRGVLNESEAKRYEKPCAPLANGFELSGLGQWVDAVNNADQHIVFGG
ncbi:Putative sulfurtransferase DsrE [BD1-7 clade bacterium]|uniref:Sulfurtransferase DsrE n=1 Tax=BD1-7 clade bacterium TaxID=2029982 RepID=A0A5S9QCD8_9GAMM|nr:Putative sulfurtransferase DsrE [BD1-7 clade bacterium]CAA0115928.1 Putative sulfurtransferase DsrE [BD1-7 clade bacterium]CAA0119591.1 Putative sulfurtransferase DsrE [BD1-7 clade bacterium]